MKYWVYINDQILDQTYEKEDLSSIPGFSRDTLIVPEGQTTDGEPQWVPAYTVLEPTTPTMPNMPAFATQDGQEADFEEIPTETTPLEIVEEAPAQEPQITATSANTLLTSNQESEKIIELTGKVQNLTSQLDEMRSKIAAMDNHIEALLTAGKEEPVKYDIGTEDDILEEAMKTTLTARSKSQQKADASAEAAKHFDEIIDLAKKPDAAAEEETETVADTIPTIDAIDTNNAQESIITEPTDKIEKVEEIKEAEEVKPVEEVKPEEPQPAEKIKQTDELKPLGEAKEVEEVKPEEEMKPTEEDNSTEEKTEPKEETKITLTNIDIPSEVPAAEEITTRQEESDPNIMPPSASFIEQGPSVTERGETIEINSDANTPEAMVLQEFAAEKQAEPKDLKEDSNTQPNPNITDDKPYDIVNVKEEAPKEDGVKEDVKEEVKEEQEITTLDELTGRGMPTLKEEDLAKTQDINDKFLKTFTSSIEEVFLDQPTSIISDYIPQSMVKPEEQDFAAQHQGSAPTFEGQGAPQRQDATQEMPEMQDLKTTTEGEHQEDMHPVRRIKPADIKTVPMVSSADEAEMETINYGDNIIDEARAERDGQSTIMRFIKMFSALAVLLVIILAFVGVLAAMSIIPKNYSPAHIVYGKFFGPKITANAPVKQSLPTTTPDTAAQNLQEQPADASAVISDGNATLTQEATALQADGLAQTEALSQILDAVKNYQLQGGQTLEQKINTILPNTPAGEITWTVDPAVEQGHYSVAIKLPPNMEGYSLSYRFDYNADTAFLSPTTSESKNLMNS